MNILAESSTPSPISSRTIQPSPSGQSLDARISNMNFNNSDELEGDGLEDGECVQGEDASMDVTMEDEEAFINYA